MKIVIIGNGPAAVSAVEAIRTHQKIADSINVEILMFSNETAPAYAPMFLTKYVAGQLEEKQLYLRDNGFYDRLRIKSFFNEPVDRIDDKNKIIILQSGREVNYDKLLISTGTVAIKPPINGIDREGHVFVLNKLVDAKRLLTKIATSKQVVVVGAGAIGIEVATTLNALGLDITMIEMVDQVAPTLLDKEGARLVETSLLSRGIKLILGEEVSEIFCTHSSKGCILGGGTALESDLIILCIGVRPAMDVVKSTDVKTRQGIVVNEKMETQAPDIYAAGDVTESRNLYGEFSLNFTWYSAIEQGWIAGCNMIGTERHLTHSARLNVLKGLDFLCTAISQMPSSLEDYEELTNELGGQDKFEKIVLNKGCIIQYQGVNVSADKIGFMYQAIKTGRNLAKYKKQLFRTRFGAAYML